MRGEGREGGREGADRRKILHFLIKMLSEMHLELTWDQDETKITPCLALNAKTNKFTN